MVETQPGSSRRWTPRTADRARAFNTSRECLKVVELVVKVPPHGAITAIKAYFSKHLEDCYISRDALEPLGWSYQTDKIPKRRISPWGGILKPIGSVELRVRQLSDDPATPFQSITFHVVEGSPSQNDFGLVIGESGCNKILGEGFNFAQFNENCRREVEEQQRQELELEQALQQEQIWQQEQQQAWQQIQLQLQLEQRRHEYQGYEHHDYEQQGYDQQSGQQQWHGQQWQPQLQGERVWENKEEEREWQGFQDGVWQEQDEPMEQDGDEDMDWEGEEMD